MERLAKATWPGRAPAAAAHVRVLDTVLWVNEALVVLALAIDLAITFANTVARYVFNGGITWIPDASAICMTVMTFLGAAAFLRRGGGMAYTALVDLLGGTWRDILRSFGLCMILVICLASLFAFPAFFQASLGRVLPVLDVTEAVADVWQGVGLVLMLLYTAEQLVALPRRGVLAALAATLVLCALLAVLRHVYFTTDFALDPLIPVALAMGLAFAAATPIAFILAGGGTPVFRADRRRTDGAVPAAYQGGIGSFVLLAIPFFMVAGTLMEITGMAARMIDMVQAWIGHWRGGLLIAEVVAMYVFSGMSGSKAADIATVGSVMKLPLRRGGYAPTESVAVLAAAAAMGEVVPPSLALLLLGSITTLSVGALFVAACCRRRCWPCHWSARSCSAAAAGGSRRVRRSAGGARSAASRRPSGADGTGDRGRRHRRRHRGADRGVVARRGLRAAGRAHRLPLARLAAQLGARSAMRR